MACLTGRAQGPVGTPLATWNPLQPRRDGERFHLGCPVGLEQFGQQESEFDRLFGVEPRIAQRVVAIVQVLVADCTRPACTFGDVLAGHLQVDAAAVGAFRSVNREEGLHLLQDAVERARLVAALRRDRIAVHRVARPHHRPALALDRAHQRREIFAGLVRAQAADQRQPPRFVVGVEDVDQPHQFVGFDASV